MMQAEKLAAEEAIRTGLYGVGTSGLLSMDFVGDIGICWENTWGLYLSTEMVN